MYISCYFPFILFEIKVGILPRYTDRIAEPGVIHIIDTNRALIEPFIDAVDEALLQYSQTEMNNGEAMELIENQDIQSIC